jgi:hypothetical protein
MKKGNTTLCDCGHTATCGGSITGYGIDREGKTFCYVCAGKRDREELISTGKQIGYLSFSDPPLPDSRGRHLRLGYIYDPNGYYGNWPGTFIIPVHHVKRSRNNFGAYRLDFWFTFEGARYWGVNVGDNQLARVQRIKG